MKVPEIILTETAWIHGGGKVQVTDEQEVTLREFLGEEITHVNGDLYPFHAFDALEVKTDIGEKEIEDDNCKDGDEPEPPTPIDPPSFEGLDDVSVPFGGAFNPREGVVAKDGNGNDIPFEVTGMVDTDTPGEYVLTYTATDSEGQTTTLTRKVTVENPTTAPVFSGVSNVTINQGIGIDLMDGVTATDATGKTIQFTVSPTEIDECAVGSQVVTYTATDEWGNTATVERTITITQASDPTISGLDTLTVMVGEEFNPLDGVSAVDDNGNPLEVTVVEQGEEELIVDNSVNWWPITSTHEKRGMILPIHDEIDLSTISRVRVELENEDGTKFDVTTNFENKDSGRFTAPADFFFTGETNDALIGLSIDEGKIYAQLIAYNASSDNIKAVHAKVWRI